MSSPVFNHQIGHSEHSESGYSLISVATSDTDLATDLDSRPTSPTSQDSRVRDQIAQGMEEMLAKCRPELRRLMSASLPHSAQGASLDALLDQIDCPFTNPTELQAKCAEFINLQKDSPNVVSSVLRYISAQAMLIDGLEKLLLAEEMKTSPRLSGGIKSFIMEAQSKGQDPTTRLQNKKFSPVLTAHPTQISRVGSVELFTDGTSSPTQLANKAWEVQGPRETAPTVLDEVERFQDPLRRIMKSGHKLGKQINEHLRDSQLQALEKGVITVGSWPAGDRDGNPNITAQTLIDAVALNAKTALDFYARKLSPDKLRKTSEVGTANLRQLLDQAGQSGEATNIFDKLNNTTKGIGNELTEESQQTTYRTPDELIDDLKQLKLSGLTIEQQALAKRKISSLIADIQAHGFHGASTDIRQNSAVNHNTIEILLILNDKLGELDYKTLNELDKQQLLQSLLDQPGDLNWTDSIENISPEKLSKLNKAFPPDAERKANKALAQFKQEIELIHSYKTIHERFGQKALQNCITANTEQVSDLMEVMVLLRHAGVAGTTENGDSYCNMNVVPLIETVDDLKNATEILSGLLGNTWYKNALAQTDNRQLVMVGYSDSARLAGSFASNWGVYKATQKMVLIGKDKDMELLFFHGRGGTEARGAGVDYADEIGIHSGASLQKGFQQTDQGEMAIGRYGNQTLSDTHLDQMIGATLAGMSTIDQPVPDENWALIMDEIADTAEGTYLHLYKDPNLVNFIQENTPLDYTGKANAGSRPPKRTEGTTLKLESLRAIPSAAAWIQSGLMVPAFYGTGTGVSEYLNQAKSPTDKMERIQSLRKMYQAWPMFKNLIDRTEMAMSKFESKGVAERSRTNAASQAILGQIEEEARKTVDIVNLIKNQSSLLEGRTPEKERLNIRMKPLAWARGLQQELLKFAHNSPSKAEQFKKPIVESIQAVAHSLGRFG